MLFLLINVFTVNRSNTSRIFRLFHTSFYFKGINPRIHKSLNMFNGTHILKAERIIFVVLDFVCL